MAGQDIQMNAFKLITDAKYLYGEAADGSQGKIARETLMEKGGIYRFYGNVGAGKSLALPYVSGIILIQNASAYHAKALALLDSSGNGTVLVSQESIKFFSEIDSKICIYNSGPNTPYILKNKYSIDRAVSVLFIG